MKSMMVKKCQEHWLLKQKQKTNIQYAHVTDWRIVRWLRSSSINPSTVDSCQKIKFSISDKMLCCLSSIVSTLNYLPLMLNDFFFTAIDNILSLWTMAIPSHTILGLEFESHSLFSCLPKFLAVPRFSHWPLKSWLWCDPCLSFQQVNQWKWPS